MSRVGTTHLSLLLRLRDRTDKLSWRDFHRRYGELLYRYARRRGASAVDAEDIVQEVEMYLFKAMEGFQYDAGKGKFRNYLRSAVLHAMGRRAARRAREGEALDPRAFDYLTAERDARADEQWEREWRLHRMRWALRRVAKDIEPITIRAFRAHVLQGKTAQETADRLEISTASVYQAKSRILKRLKAQLKVLDPDGNV